MSDVASLEIRVLSTQVAQANQRLDELEKKGGRAERATDGLGAAFKRLAGPLLAAVSATAALSKLIETTREFDKLNAGLITATGSAENAKVAFEAIQDFATNTPYDLGQVTDAFTKLVNYGLTPSEKALTAYGDTASAMGKDLNQMIEAVADAATGEFERLKEFGIRASKQGDTIKFTFRGVTTEVKNSSSEIESYLIKLGENNFAGAMAQRMDTLDGALSNLGDEWSKLFLNVSQLGVGSVIEDAVKMAIDILSELNAMLASGEMEGYLSALAAAWSGWGTDIRSGLDFLTGYISDTFKKWTDDNKSTIDFLINAFKEWPQNVRAFIQIITVEIAALVDRAKVYGRAIADNLNPFNGYTTLADIRRQIDAIGQARLASIDSILAERNAATSAADAEIAKAKQLRAEYDKARAARGGGDRLAGFKQGGGDTASGSVDKAAVAAAKKRQEEFQRLVESLRTEEEAIKASYEKRRAIIEQNTSAGSTQRADLMSRLNAEYEEQLKALREAKGRELEQLRQSLLSEEESIAESYAKRVQIVRDNTEAGSAQQEELLRRLQLQRDTDLKSIEEQRQRERDSLYNGLLTEEESLRQSYERRKQQILESTAVTEAERLDLMKRLEEQYTNEMAQIEQKRMQTQLSNAASLFDGLAGLAKAYSGEQSKAYRVLFAISKAFSVTQAAMSIATGLAKAQELGFPANLAEMARVAATGASILASIKGSNFSGAYDEGGRIPAGKIGLVGEYGPELVSGPANVTSRKDTAALLKDGQSGAQPQVNTNLRIVNAFDTGVIGDYMGSDRGEEIIMNVVRLNQATIREMAAGG